MSDMKASVDTLADGFTVNGFEELKYGMLLLVGLDLDWESSLGHG